MKRTLCLLSVLSLVAATGIAQTDAAKKPLRVHVLGASVSGGFCDGPLFGAEEQGDSVTLQHVLKRWAGDQARVTTHNTIEMMAFFTDPLSIGKNQIDSAQKQKPDIVVAIDFPFWFAYGHMSGDEAVARKERLAEGLAMLATFDVPILIGDLPDMQGAAKRMLSERQIPKPALLKELNAQIAEWVAAHDKVRLIELSGIVRQMRDEGIALPLAGGPVQTPKGALQQGDRLHATRLGMAFLGFRLQTALGAAFPAGHTLRGQQWTFEQFVAAAGAEGELETLAAAAAQRGQGSDAKAGGAGKGGKE